MPSKKKKARGKARRVAKRGKTKDDDGVNGIDSQMQRLQISSSSFKEGDDGDEDALLEAAINLAAAEREELKAAAKNDEANNSEECVHGLVSYSKNPICRAFMKSFDNACKTASGSGNHFECAYEVTKREYAEVWNDPDKLQWIASRFLAHGTKDILRGEYDVSRGSAGMACFFEQSAAIAMHELNDTQDSCDWGTYATLCDWGKQYELCDADPYTLVSFFRKRIPCKCLDSKYKEVKSITKIGLCYNYYCSLPDRKTARGKMLSCTQCRRANYCSRECQVAHWPTHKRFCSIDARWLAARKSGQKKKAH